ncbi:formylglycine-generating enzyme family protein [Aphanothece hegewaldii CCALA 016]|uniref:Formylglycine-generating enzyme family protein n=1 Tax=Aphanothece hegewaldii CCALA 016 TaxID=2107694 RepID=A0A2T1LWZ4_9CHRO|nr:formylglycine-generating enzyme family protein [Aphanothece hegewaldii]PSF36584.1 formylglycine-generating enzyme family protein [Aphanothece hegewaldii CCALA 016]
MSDLSVFEFDVVTVNETGERIKSDRSSKHFWTEDLGKNILLEMVSIPYGMFLMGTPETEIGWHFSQSPQHLVTIQPFFMSRYPITQAQWQAIAKCPQVNIDLNPYPANFEDNDRPVEQINWYEAVEFCARLSQKCDRIYRLPTEAEWEYACRATTITPFHFGATITTDLANYSGVNWEYQGKVCNHGAYGQGPQGEDRRETTPVGYFGVANAFGLSDLHGNVREWCADHWHNNYENAPPDGTAWLDGGDSSKRVLRGGSWNVGPIKCRSSYRVKYSAEASLYDVGFRVVCS